MTAPHVEVLTEEPSMEAFLELLMPRLLPEATFAVHSFQNKQNLLKKLGGRLRAYGKWLPENYRIAVVIDRDGEDCHELKDQLEFASVGSGLATRTQIADSRWRIVNRIVVEELEAWYFGDWEAVCRAYPRASRNIPNKARYRYPDSIKGGTWEAFERIMQRCGYFEGGLRKVEVARAIAKFIDPGRNRSHSFLKFRDAILEAVR